MLLYAFNRVIFAAQIPPSVQIGKDTLIAYSGLGTVIHKRAVIGARVSVGAGVVIGGRSKLYEVPVIEDDVQIGAGAKVLGPVRVGRAAVIGANAVVIHDVPPSAVVVGIPARVLRVIEGGAGGVSRTGT